MSNPSFQTVNGATYKTSKEAYEAGVSKLHAIKAYRFATSKRLADCKNAVELAMSSGCMVLLGWNPKQCRDGTMYTRDQFVAEMHKAGFLAKPSQEPYYQFRNALSAFLRECNANGDNARSVGMKMLNEALGSTVTDNG